MVEQNNNQEESKSKVQIPVEETQQLLTKTTAPSEPIPNDADGDLEEEKSDAATVEGRGGKVIDQRASNIPIDNPDLEDLIELLEQTGAQL